MGFLFWGPPGLVDVAVCVCAGARSLRSGLSRTKIEARDGRGIASRYCVDLRSALVLRVASEL